jgi:hypothetical protein
MSATLILTPVDAVAARARHARTWERLSGALLAGRVADAVAQCAPGARVELAAPVAGLPASVSGSGGIVATWQGLAVLVRRVRVLERDFRPTTDPDVGVAEHLLEVELRDGARHVVALRTRVTFDGEHVVALQEEPGSELAALVQAVLRAAHRV